MDAHHFTYLLAWLGTGTVGLVGGFVAVTVARRRLRSERTASNGLPA